MKGKIKELIGKLIIYLSRKNYSQDKIKQFHKIFLYAFLPIFIITTFRVNPIENPIENGFSISANATFVIINLFILSLVTLIFYLYVQYFEEIRIEYLNKLFKDHNQVVCAYSDEVFDDSIYKIDKSTIYYSSRIHIHMTNGNIYSFDDWRSFKFVGIKESRKRKLDHLKSIIDGNSKF